MELIRGLHRTDGSEREENDYYATHPSAILPLLQFLNWSESKLIRENSCGEGHLSKELEKHGHRVISSDLIDRGYGVTGVDYLKPNFLDMVECDVTIMNPPYKYAQAFIEKACSQTPVVCAFLKLQFLEGVSRLKTLWKTHPPKYVLVFSYRVKSSKHGRFHKGESSTVAYAWYIWEQGFKGSPAISWIEKPA